MAVYDFRCRECGEIAEDVILPMTHDLEQRPQCCGIPMGTHITAAPMVHWKDYDVSYRPISVPNAEPITSRKQEREFMARHGLVHAESPPPTKQEQMEAHKKVVESIDKVAAPKGREREFDIV